MPSRNEALSLQYASMGKGSALREAETALRASGPGVRASPDPPPPPFGAPAARLSLSVRTHAHPLPHLPTLPQKLSSRSGIQLFLQLLYRLGDRFWEWDRHSGGTVVALELRVQIGRAHV